MKQTFRILLAFYGVVILLLASCRKSDYQASVQVNANTNSVDYTLINQLFSAIAPKTQSFTVAAGDSRTIVAMTGTKLNFYPNSFKDKNDNIITSGTINLQIQEMYNAGYMLGGKTSGTCNGRLLRSNGQVNIIATMNGQEVFANVYGINFKVPTATTQHCSLFYGQTLTKDSVVTWTPSSGYAGTSTDATQLDSFKILTVDSAGRPVDTMVIHTNYNKFDSCKKFNLISCADFFAAGGATGNMVVNFTDTTFNNSNTSVFLVFRDIKSECFLNNYNSASHSFSFNPGYEVPVGSNVDMVAIANINGRYYFNLQTGITTSVGLALTAHMYQSNLNQIIIALAAL